MVKQSVIIIDSDEISRSVAENYLKNIKDSELVGSFSSIDDLKIENYSDLKNLLLYIDISDNVQKQCEFIERFVEFNQNVKVIVTALNYDTNTVIKAMRSGAKDFLPKPLLETDFINTISKFSGQSDNKNKKTNCKVITPFSNKGGIGKTSIAINLALELANITKEKVALVDMNFHLGDVANFLDIKPSFNISYVAKNLKESDDSFLITTLDKYKNTNLYVLADSPYLEQSQDITTTQISELFAKMRENFAYIVVDTGNIFDEKTVTVLDNTDFIMLVSVVNLPAIRNCQRCLDIFERLGYSKDKTKIVINRYMENDEITIDDVEKALNQKVYWKVPNNYFTLISAINKGLPVSEVNQSSNIAKSYRELATILSDNLYKQKIADKVVRNKNFDFKTLM
ncbi:MAG: AAA family ATPase [Candidatus Gastranaerophilaceae bacterium]